MKVKKRLDIVLAQQYTQYSRRQVQSFIMQGHVRVGGAVFTKPGTQVDQDVAIELTHEEPRYVSRAGFKLEHALDRFTIDVSGLIVLDAGLSTGGFADCLLQRGAAKVYGVDVGYGQVHEKIRHDPHVVVMERTNLRTLDGLPEPVDLVTLDLSFISVLKVMSAIVNILKPDGKLIVLIKPQFEAGRRDVRRGGLVTDPAVHERVIKDVVTGIQSYGFEYFGVIDSPIAGAQGNKEFLAYFVKKQADTQ